LSRYLIGQQSATVSGRPALVDVAGDLRVDAMAEVG
jgi:hypothetical protein